MLDGSPFDNYLAPWLKKKNGLKDLEARIARTGKATLSLLSRNKWKKKSNAGLAHHALVFYEKFRDQIVSAALLRRIDRAVQPKLREMFSLKQNVDECMRLAGVSKRAGFLVQEKEALLKLAVVLKKKRQGVESPAARRGLEKVWASFAWVSCGYYNEKPRSMEEYAKELREMLAGNPFNQLIQLEKQQTADLKARKKVLSGLSKAEKKIANVTAEASFLKDYYKFSINQSIYCAEPFFQEISARTNVSAETIKELLPQETAGLLKGEKLDWGLVSERKRHYVLISFPGAFEILTGRHAEEFESTYLGMQVQDQFEWKGRVASPGKAVGLAKVVLGQKDFSTFNAGDILVVTNTSPDFVPLMKKAAAIVAEEGGLTAHVSVVSREFGIPCIVGIEHITRVLKNGDKIEVDARLGLVKRLT